MLKIGCWTFRFEKSGGLFPALKSGMITGFAPRISRNDVIRLSVFFLRIASLGAAVLYAIAAR